MGDAPSGMEQAKDLTRYGNQPRGPPEMKAEVIDPSPHPHAAWLSYRPGRSTPCPSCGARQWVVGRVVAECAACDTVLPIEAGYRAWVSTGALNAAC